MAQPIDHSKLKKRVENEKRQQLLQSKREAKAQGAGAYSSRGSRNRSKSVGNRSRSARKYLSGKNDDRVVRGGKLMLKKYKSFVRQFRKAGAEGKNRSIERGESDSDDNWRGPSDFTRLSVRNHSRDDCVSERDSVRHYRSKSRRSSRKHKKSRSRK